MSCFDSNEYNFKLLPLVLLNSFNPNFGIIGLSYLFVNISYTLLLHLLYIFYKATLAI